MRKKKLSSDVQSRAGMKFLWIIFIAAFGLLAAKYFIVPYTGEVDGVVLQEELDNMYTVQEEIPAKRGTITDRNGNVLANDTVCYNMYAVLDETYVDAEGNPLYVVDPAYTAEQLAPYIDMPQEEIERILSKEGVYQVEFGSAGKELPSYTMAAIESLELPGIYFTQVNVRFYPNSVFASHAIGIVNNVEDPDTGEMYQDGVMGLEQQYNEALTGTPGTASYKGDTEGRPFPNEEPIEDPAAQDGMTLVTTFDKVIQSILEDAMQKVYEEYRPTAMVGIVADPDTGAILAMSQRPTFNLNTKEGVDATWQNLCIEAVYEPGSTMKIFTLAAAINEGVWNPDETYMSGTYKVGEETVRDHNNTGWGEITYLEGLQRSSNVAFAKIVMEKLTPPVFLEYLEAFGFGQPTEIDLPNEASGTISYKYPIEQANTAFGQGTTVTAIQMVQATTAIASDGSMKQPYVVEQIIDPNTGKVVYDHETEVVGQPITAETAAETRMYLETTVSSENGTGYNYKSENYEVAGKTGTAQYVDPTTGDYATGYDNYIFSFMGMAPADDPELIVYVAIKQPDLDAATHESGSVPVSQVFNPVMENSLKYLNITPSSYTEATPIEVGSYVGTIGTTAKTELEALGVTPIVLGNPEGEVVSQSHMPGDLVLPGEKIVIYTGGDITMPNMTGWSMGDVMKVTGTCGLELSVSGSGYVVSQTPAPGTVVKPGETVTVTLKPPI